MSHVEQSELIKPTGCDRKIGPFPCCSVVQGDCLELMKQLPDGCVEIAVTSPPYNLKRQWWDQGANGIHPNLAKKFTQDWYDDTLPEDEYQKQQRALLEDCIRVSDVTCYNHKVRYAFKREGCSFHPMQWIAGLPLWCEIIWDRFSGVAFNSARPTPADERIFVLSEKPSAWHSDGDTNIWRIYPEPQDNGHPCPFPEELPARCIRLWTDSGATVLDPYAGSGTTLVAAKKLGRHFLGFEISPEYCEIARKRLDAIDRQPSLFQPKPEQLGLEAQ